MNADNLWTLTGNLTRDPEVKVVGESKVAKFSLAYNKVFKSKGERKEQTSFFDVEVWGAQADVAGNYLKKGSKVTVLGEAFQDSWEKEGEKRSKVIMKVTDIRLRGGKAESVTSESSAENSNEGQDGVPF